MTSREVRQRDVRHEAGGARLMVGFHGREVTDDFVDLLHETGARSVILFARNITSANQARDLVASIRERVDHSLLFVVDQEGGAVARVFDGATVFPGNMTLGAANDVDLARRQGVESGRQLAAMGFDLNLAPVVDLQTNPANPGIGVRSLGADLNCAAPLARALVEGHTTANVGSCLKHFPGKGAAAVDAHIDLPFFDGPLEGFRRPHIEIFERLIDDLDDRSLAIMTSHIVVRALDDVPATFSRRVVRDLLRDELEFRGLVVADDLEMGAVTRHGGVASAALRAAQAGHDVLPVCHDANLQREAARRLDAAVKQGDLDRDEHRDAVARIDHMIRCGRPGIDQIEPSSDSSIRPFETPAGDAVARRIVRAGVHLFGDRAGRLPVDPDVPMSILTPIPHAVVGAEEAVTAGWSGLVARVFGERRSGPTTVHEFDPSVEFEAPSLVDDVERSITGCDGVVLLLTWNAYGLTPMRRLLDEAVARLASRLVIAHLRNPFDQAFVPDEVTALTAFGYRVGHLEALADVSAGRLAPIGVRPAPIIAPPLCEDGF